METIDDVNRRIDNNYNFVKNIENQIRKCSDNIEKINLIKFVCVLYSEFVTGVYSDNYLEDELNNDLLILIENLQSQNLILQ